jgi:hypothetical protein
MVWQSENDGQWYYSYTGGALAFATQEEASQFMAKIDTAKAIVRAVQALAPTADGASDLEAEYFDAAGAGWVDGDVAPLGITAAQLAACLTLLQQFALLMTNGATTPIMHRTALNAVRRVSA